VAVELGEGSIDLLDRLIRLFICYLKEEAGCVLGRAEPFHALGPVCNCLTKTNEAGVIDGGDVYMP
jgi:hypothetical protein